MKKRRMGQGQGECARYRVVKRGLDVVFSCLLLFLLGLDVFFIVNGGIGALAFPEIMSYLLAGCAAFFGGYIGISLLQLVLNYFGLSGFAYYSFGAAFFSFVL